MGLGKVIDVLNKHKAEEEIAKKEDGAKHTGNLSSDYLAINNSSNPKTNPKADEYRNEWHSAFRRKSNQMALGIAPYTDGSTTYKRALPKGHRQAIKQKSNATSNQEDVLS